MFCINCPYLYLYYMLVYTTTVDSVLRMLWLATQTPDWYPVLFTDSSPAPPSERRQTHVSYEQNGFPVCCRNKQRNLFEQAVPEIHKKGDEIRCGGFNR